MYGLSKNASLCICKSSRHFLCGQPKQNNIMRFVSKAKAQNLQQQM